ncbi:DUF58 domain-containing protein [Coleofasciculus sp. FACHB-64]|uniref:DUF58 domain-containing protein n=1 Tax=Cyanophyceae TaxID=3028117 RepID=UPI0016876D30|nr:DUF58 domain-containing protein [Coleofasciculus sp. FACHB-64]MBD2047847.1 DUF58 domain-containing protein [Coleofasciculus sp. FACHB-64]
MNIGNRIADWLETRWVTPAYAGWILGIIAVCFFGAATNTMAGWLYVISGLSFALLGIASFLSVRSLRHLQVTRRPIQPVSVGDDLTIELEIENPVNHPKTLLLVRDVLPFVLGQPVQTAIETISPHSIHHWVYYLPTQKRGVYRWNTVQLRTAAPVGLFWCRRQREVAATAFVYPTVLPLTNCPMVDEIGQEKSPLFLSLDRRSQAATEGVTRSLRPYRVGDPTRLIHWRTSARYGEFQVRELEVFTGGQEVIICLDSATSWNPEHFEQAVIAAASLYFYASGRQLSVKLWTAFTGLVQGHRVVLETLAATYAGEDARAGDPPTLPLIWLTPNHVTLSSLPPGSRWMIWMPESLTEPAMPVNRNSPGIVINSDQPLQLQLQSPLK